LREEVFPSLDCDQFTAEEQGIVHAFRWHCSGVEELASAGASVSTVGDQSTAMVIHDVTEVYERQMATVPNIEIPEVAASKPKVLPPCFLAQACVCGRGWGRNVQLVRASLHRRLKETQDTRQRSITSLFQRGRIVAMMLGWSARPDITKPERVVQVLMVAHAADTKLRPFEVYWHLMKVIRCGDGADPPHMDSYRYGINDRLQGFLPRELVLESLFEYPDDWELAMKLDFTKMWTCAFLEVVGGQQIVGDIRPKTLTVALPVVAAGTAQLHIIHDPFKKRAVGDRKGRGGWAALDDVPTPKAHPAPPMDPLLDEGDDLPPPSPEEESSGHGGSGDGGDTDHTLLTDDSGVDDPPPVWAPPSPKAPPRPPPLPPPLLGPGMPVPPVVPHVPPEDPAMVERKAPPVRQIDVIFIEGLGWLGFAPATETFVATCKKHHRCSRSKTCHDGPKPGQGHCLGWLVAWMAMDRAQGEHAHVPPEDVPFHLRQHFRNRLLAMPEARTLLEREVGDEREEPPIVG